MSGFPATTHTVDKCEMMNVIDVHDMDIMIAEGIHSWHVRGLSGVSRANIQIGVIDPCLNPGLCILSCGSSSLICGPQRLVFIPRFSRKACTGDIRTCDTR